MAEISGCAGLSADPVFVLCNGRSGSTLLRFLLDAHPDLACPPETNLPALCAQLATVWSLIEGAPLSANRGDEPPEVPAAAIAGVRATMDRMVGSYLARRGKKRYCDKSLGTARFAPLLTRVYPQARFVCVYRHPIDVIASGAEACPWGLNGYGFDPYIAATRETLVNPPVLLTHCTDKKPARFPPGRIIPRPCVSIPCSVQLSSTFIQGSQRVIGESAAWAPGPRFLTDKAASAFVTDH
jgi:Sulfotransferase family